MKKPTKLTKPPKQLAEARLANVVSGAGAFNGTVPPQGPPTPGG